MQAFDTTSAVRATNHAPMQTRNKPTRHRAKRPIRIYSESLEALQADYDQLTMRLAELDVHSIRNMNAIDRLMQRLRPDILALLPGARVQACPA